jgi:hypothetical protein
VMAFRTISQSIEGTCNHSLLPGACRIPSQQTSQLYHSPCLIELTSPVFSALTRLCTSPFKGSKGAPTYFKDVAFAAVRTQLRSMSIPQSRFLAKSTAESYYEAAKTLKFEPESIDLDGGVQAHWLGDKNAELTLVYFHGKLLWC